VPALPSSLIEPIWEQVAALLPERRDRHPLGCHRPRICDRTVFELLINVLVFGAGYRRHADRRCSATTLRRRRDEWIAGPAAGVTCRGVTCPLVSEKRSLWVVLGVSRSSPLRAVWDGRRPRSAGSWPVTATVGAPTGPRPRIRWPTNEPAGPSRPSW